MFTGEVEEITDWGSVAFTCYADEDSAYKGLIFRFGPDGVNWDIERTATVTAGETEEFTFHANSRFMQVVYTNGETAQGEFRLQVVFRSIATPEVQRPWNIEAGRGQVPGDIIVNKWGRNADVDNTGAWEDIWTGGDTYNWLTAAAPIRIRAGNAADAAAGSGARLIGFEGLDANGDFRLGFLVPNGASAGTATAFGMFRVFRGWVQEVGTYGGTNAGDVVIETTGGVAVAHIPAGYAQTQMALFTVPRNYRAQLTNFTGTVDTGSGKLAAIRVAFRPNALNTSGTYGAWRVGGQADGVAGQFDFRPYTFASYGPLTDIVIQAKATANDTAVAAYYTLVLTEAKA